LNFESHNIHDEISYLKVLVLADRLYPTCFQLIQLVSCVLCIGHCNPNMILTYLIPLNTYFVFGYFAVVETSSDSSFPLTRFWNLF